MVPVITWWVPGVGKTILSKYSLHKVKHNRINQRRIRCTPKCCRTKCPEVSIKIYNTLRVLVKMNNSLKWTTTPWTPLRVGKPTFPSQYRIRRVMSPFSTQASLHLPQTKPKHGNRRLRPRLKNPFSRTSNIKSPRPPKKQLKLQLSLSRESS